MATPVSGTQSPVDSGNEDYYNGDDQGTLSTRASRSRNRPLKRAVLSDDSGTESATPTSTRRSRGRPRVQPVTQQRSDKISASIVPADALSDEIQVEDDETVLAHVDEDGERKVDENGRLSGDRQYRVRTFTILGRGQRLYMLSTEPARCMGYRDSYLFFLKHKTLHRVLLDDDEKNDLADRELIPGGYRTRQIAVCTARSVFREFGARAVIGGRRIIDDYWTKEYRKLGYEEGTLADPEDRLPPPGVEYNSNQFVAWHGASNVYHQQPHTERRTAKRVIDDVNWITAHAQAAVSYNTELGRYRRRMLDGVHEAHTGQKVVPGTSQPQRCLWLELSAEPHDRQVIDTRIMIRPSQGASVNLLNVEENVYELAMPEIKSAIEQRRAYEAEELSTNVLDAH
ncbi:Chromatin structure-remodeling complex protein RSC7 [Taphrina deformans PYCC 5710]|uniref:Chromatin structure-remodeling complex protein RSC7 n=1 Tax=Taphrina deformans (strain PYCC 5710 / ATCC 11124 / CBS 356.35 / IMI 108563 / JCM 9778 / NBRC 8474) TaxID=1097556 RepID=R4XC74_TAPDE|nr:Chromatin structure-remodeling complex protein RSC7 [Taphrina deformans PYCC 5710]|eukprot:CCG80935.1 Chromatin structure-remodeling complex protein RSC7 [Taphrina deformans PYCC 5710]